VCVISRIIIRTWHAAAILVWSIGNQVVIEAIFQRTKNDNWPSVVHWNDTNHIIIIIIIAASTNMLPAPTSHRFERCWSTKARYEDRSYVGTKLKLHIHKASKPWRHASAIVHLENPFTNFHSNNECLCQIPPITKQISSNKTGVYRQTDNGWLAGQMAYSKTLPASWFLRWQETSKHTALFSTNDKSCHMTVKPLATGIHTYIQLKFANTSLTEQSSAMHCSEDMEKKREKKK